jgi:MarR family transcriptional regulator, organic hydroperoxide resistance regulator
VTSRPHLDLGNFLPYLVNRVSTAFVADFSENALARYDLSIAMWRVLAALAYNGEQRLIDLALMTSIDVSTLSRLVTRLLHAGLVSRKRSKTSNREVLIELTAKGRGIVDRLIPIARNLERTAVDGIVPKDLAAIKRSLRRIYENMEKSESRSRRQSSRTAGRAAVRD